MAPALTRPWHVGSRSETIVDRTRGTARRGSVRASHTRVIRITYYYPDRGSVDAAGAAASPEGPFPVIVFSPGYAVTPQTYERTLHAWAAAGYLVVGVLSPGSGGGLPGTPTEADLGAQPRDLSLALSTVARHTVDPTSWLGGVADLHRVAVAGHSDGGSTAAAAGLLQRYTDSRWDAVLVMAGASFGGQPARKALPLLVLSGQRDEFNSQSTFDDVYDLGRSTRTWVQAIGAHHLPPFIVAGRQADDLRALEVAFFDRSLLGADTASLERSLSNVRGVTRIAAGRF
jgi:dienelactone hydrolase